MSNPLLYITRISEEENKGYVGFRWGSNKLVDNGRLRWGSQGAARYFKAGRRAGCSSSLVAVSGMNFVLQTVDWLHELGKKSDEKNEPGGFSPVTPKDDSRRGIVS